jgi:hypothetical protein
MMILPSSEAVYNERPDGENFRERTGMVWSVANNKLH